MARQRVIVCIGEVLLCEHPDRTEPGGLAALAALNSLRLGHVGLPISRLGQDLAANELLTQLKGLGLNIDHLQSDPDLPTGRLIVRSIAGRTQQSLQPRAAFDNLQWDFDLVDVAQTADGVVFGAMAQREGQSQSIIKRFLAECTSAVRVFDLVNRDRDLIDRTQLLGTLEFAHGLIADRVALKALVPAWDGKQVGEPALELLRNEAAFIITIERGECSQTMTFHTADQATPAPRSYPAAQHEAAVIGLLHGVLNGWDSSRCLALACDVADHVAKHPDKPMPRAILDR